MKLTVKDRLQILAVLPLEGNLLNLQILRRLREALAFSEAEYATYGLTYDPQTNMSRWERNADLPREYQFKPVATELITQAFQRLSEAGQLTPDLLATAEKFLASDPIDEVVTAAPVQAAMTPIESKNGDVLEAAVVG